MAKSDYGPGEGRNLSGRFRLQVDSTHPKRIVTVADPASFRVHNSGKTNFQLNAGAGILTPRASMDCGVATTLDVTSPSLTALNVEGIYERLSADSPVRHGKIYVEANSQTTVIVRDRPDTVYRLMNSGRKSFRINCGTIPAIELPGRREESRSIDVLNSTGTITITDSATQPNKNSPYEGNFEDVDLYPTVRLGRFKIAGNATVANTERLVIAVTSGESFEREYRFVNTGRNAVQLYQTTMASGKLPLHTLDAESSVDVVVIGSISVSATAADQDIRGVYFSL